MTAVAAPAGAGTDAAPKNRRTLRTIGRGMPLLPALVLMVVFVAGPIVYCIVYAFTDMQLTGSAHTHFVGFKNFETAFTSSEFYTSVLLTLIFTVVSSIIGQNVLGLALAAMFRSAARPVRAVTGSIVIAAWVLPEVVAAYLLYAFFRREGSLNAILDAVGLPGQNWLYTVPIIAVSVANVWRGTAFSMLIYTAALGEVPQEVQEAAEMDGASTWQRLWRVTIPMIRRSIGTNLMLNTLQTLSVFGLIYVMTAGGPGGRSETLPVYMYEQAFKNAEIGYGTAVALLLLVVGGLFSVVYMRLLKTEV